MEEYPVRAARQVIIKPFWADPDYFFPFVGEVIILTSFNSFTSFPPIPAPTGSRHPRFRRVQRYAFSVQHSAFIPYFCLQSHFMEVNDSLIEHLCKLANLEFDEAGKQEIKKDLEKMIGFVEKLKAFDVTGVEPLLYMGEETDILREDILEPSISRSDALKNAPLADDQYFKVPRVVKAPSA
jgi:aspartyl-tRNA(Asn)/glutamyl-tRNA(Gln) amidotransferase subunit C